MSGRISRPITAGCVARVSCAERAPSPCANSTCHATGATFETAIHNADARQPPLRTLRVRRGHGRRRIRAQESARGPDRNGPRRTGPRPERRNQDVLDVIHRSAGRMNRLIQDLLDVTLRPSCPDSAGNMLRQRTLRAARAPAIAENARRDERSPGLGPGEVAAIPARRAFSRAVERFAKQHVPAGNRRRALPAVEAQTSFYL